ncbi:MAG: DUF4382 domain-containing protein [Gemmatimonadaceae bacterium]|nr:DUF4382 domain-containing protein [Gemmatimonadaceae bacterium]
MHTRLGLLTATALAAGAVLACSDSGTASDSGQLNIMLTDAPFPFSEVKSVDVFILRIDGKIADVDSAEAASSDSAGWKTLVSPNSAINLLSLTKGQTANLGSATLPNGNYRGFRLILDTDKSSVTLNDGTKPDVKWPSAGKNGIKIILDNPVVVGPGSTNMLIDFDVGRSFVMRGNSISQNGLLFKPVIHAVSQQSTGSVAGTVRGDNTTGTVIAGATVEVLKNGTTLTDTNSNNIVSTGVTDASGNFTLAFLPPGTYVVRATPPAASVYKPALLAGGVTITAGSAVTGKIIVLPK